MPLDYDQLMSLASRGEECAYSEHDTMLYALAVGMGRDPLDRRELAFVYEGFGLRAVPAMASRLAGQDFLADCGWDYSRVMHAAESLRLHRPLAPAGRFVIDSRVTGVVDKGAGGGAWIFTESRATRVAGGEPLFTVRRTIVARGDGGFGGPSGPRPAPHEIPGREPDLLGELPTRPDQALLYRLCGDLNPLHADPGQARRLGLRAPILHGLCSYGIACRSVLQTVCEYDPTLITEFEVRFTAPAYPGETLVTEMWQTANIVSFRVRARERDVVILDHGRCVLAA